MFENGLPLKLPDLGGPFILVLKKVLDRNWACGYFVDTSVITARSKGRPH